MTIVIASDHGGFEAKNELKKHLLEKGYSILDDGTFSLESCNYAEYGLRAAEDVAEGKADFGEGRFHATGPAGIAARWDAGARDRAGR